ncbi:MAG: penicillin-binding protein activator [Pseudohongiellaceae bacterium]
MKTTITNRLARSNLLVALILVLGCSSSPTNISEESPPQKSTVEYVDELLASAQTQSGSAAAELTLQALETMLNAGFIERAQLEAEQHNLSVDIPSDLRLRYLMVRAQLDLQSGRIESALQWLRSPPASEADTMSEQGRNYFLLLGDTLMTLGETTAAIQAYVSSSITAPKNEIPVLFEKLWIALTDLDDENLANLASLATTYELRGWVELARIVRIDEFSIRSQLDSIAQWMRVWARHSAVNQLPEALVRLQQTWNQRPSHIALILPLQQPAGNAIQEGFLSAYYQALEISREVPRISVFDSSTITSIYPIYEEATAAGADLIIGPLNKQFVNQLAQLPVLPTTTLALNYSDSTPLDKENLFQFGLAPEDEINQVVQLAWENGYKNAAIIAPRSEDYLRLQEHFIEQWTITGGAVVSGETYNDESSYAEIIKRLIAIDSSEARAGRLLDLLPRNNMEFVPRRRNDIDFIFLIANPRQGRQIKPTLAFYFAGDLPVYSLPSIYDGQDNQSENNDLNGIVFADAPWMLQESEELRLEMDTNLRQVQGQLQRLRAMGVDSFRLYPRLQQFYNQGVKSMQGSTGKLSMSKEQRIQRTLDLAQFENGFAREYRKERNSSSN